MKKLVCVVALLFVLSLVTNHASAVTDSPTTLEAIADEFILVERVDSDLESTVVYSNLQEFFTEARNRIPDLTDLELAEFTVEYTGQQEGGVVTEPLEILTFWEISTATQYFAVPENGDNVAVTMAEAYRATSSEVSPQDIWESDDGYIMMITNVGLLDNDGTYSYYALSVHVDWLTIPDHRYTDTLAITYSGVCDDEYTIVSNYRQKAVCNSCGEELALYESESYGINESTGGRGFITNSPIIELDFSQGHAIGSKIGIERIQCYNSITCLWQDTITTDLYSYLKIGIIVPEMGEARAAYAHTYLQTDITIGASVSPGAVTPTFSGEVSTGYKRYVAAPITLRVE